MACASNVFPVPGLTQQHHRNIGFRGQGRESKTTRHRLIGRGEVFNLNLERGCMHSHITRAYSHATAGSVRKRIRSKCVGRRRCGLASHAHAQRQLLSSRCVSFCRARQERQNAALPATTRGRADPVEFRVNRAVALIRKRIEKEPNLLTDGELRQTSFAKAKAGMRFRVRGARADKAPGRFAPRCPRFVARAK